MPVEEIIEKYPKANGFFLERRIMCMVCGEPFWGTLAELLGQKGYGAEEIETIVGECNKFISN